ncbi:hypothetical protein D1872_35930 [compost metagenome]
MDEDKFLALIQKHGEENIIGFGFDNSGRHLFTKEYWPFSLAKHYDPTTQCLEYWVPDRDGMTTGNGHIAVKPINTIQSVLIATKDTVWERLDAWMLSN